MGKASEVEFLELRCSGVHVAALLRLVGVNIPFSSEV